MFMWIISQARGCLYLNQSPAVINSQLSVCFIDRLCVCVCVCVCVQLEGQLEVKHCLVVRSHSGEFVLNGAKCSFSSLGELLQHYQKEALRSDTHVFQFSHRCPPLQQRSDAGSLLRIGRSAPVEVCE